MSDALDIKPVENEVSKDTDMPKIKFIPAEGEPETVEAEVGKTLLDVALDNNIRIDHNCGGNCACSTCHVIIEEGYDSLNEVTEDEEDMLDEADNLTDTSRLACQCKISTDMVVRIPPKESTWDDDVF